MAPSPPDSRRLALLAEGSFTPLDAKTAVGVLRYRPERVAAVIDAQRAGRTAEACVGTGGAIPVVTDVAAAAAHGARALLVGVAPQGGGLPRPYRRAVEEALDRGWDVWSGMHEFLADDPELAARARARGARLHDVRRPPAERRVARGLAREAGVPIVLTVGTDCNVGKMTAALELCRALERRGVRPGFVATGQTGILIAGDGVAVDAVVADFAAGAVEERVCAAARSADVVVVEGQGALHHPGYSGVTLALLHGACPTDLVLCHAAGRATLRLFGAPERQFPIPSLAATRAAHEMAAAWLHPARVVGGALNTHSLDEAAARAACGEAAAALGVPVVDPVRHGADALAEAVLARHPVGRSTPH